MYYTLLIRLKSGNTARLTKKVSREEAQKVVNSLYAVDSDNRINSISIVPEGGITR